MNCYVARSDAFCSVFVDKLLRLCDETAPLVSFANWRNS